MTDKERQMLGRTARWALTALAAGVLAFVAVGGPATARHFINGSTIKPGSIGGTQLANGAVSSSKLSRSLKRALTGKTGKTGASGAAGAKGDTGGRGAPGAFDVVDTQGRSLGKYAGSYAAGFTNAYTSDGAILIYDGNISISYPTIVASTVIYYKVAGCTGTAYGVYNASYPLQTAIVLETPPVAGSQIYVMTTGTQEAFTYQSLKTSGGCTNSSGGISQTLPVRTAGVVPAVQKPLALVPVG